VRVKGGSTDDPLPAPQTIERQGEADRLAPDRFLVADLTRKPSKGDKGAHADHH
jgi:hypothetical protein